MFALSLAIGQLGVGAYAVRLMSAFQKLKSAKDVAYEFIVCDAKPHCAIMVAKCLLQRME